MQTVELGKGDTMVSDIHADDFAGICFHKQDMPIGQETREHEGKTDEDVEAFLRIITTDVRSLDVIIAACERAKEYLPNDKADGLWHCPCGYSYHNGVDRCVKCGAYRPNDKAQFRA